MAFRPMRVILYYETETKLEHSGQQFSESYPLHKLFPGFVYELYKGATSAKTMQSKLRYIWAHKTVWNAQNLACNVLALGRKCFCHNDHNDVCASKDHYCVNEQDL
jgi:hypothetical protein